MATPSTPHSGPTKVGLLSDIGVNAVLPYLAYLGLTRYGIAVVPALAAGALFPAIAAVATIINQRRVAALGVIVLAATAASMAGAAWFTDPFLLLAKGSLITGVIGLIFLVSLLTQRPMVYQLASTGQDAASRQQSEAMWRNTPGYRHVMYRLTLIWAAALMAEASLRLLLIPLLPIAIFLPVSEVMWIAFFALMTAWSWRYGRRARERLLLKAGPSTPAPGSSGLTSPRSQAP